ncbi:MAG: methyltransferase domain-containing protein [Myxococcota bacterium]
MIDPYDDAELYDLEYQDHDEDVAHYVSLARAAGGPTLELGCGSGRLTLAIAAAGCRIVGVDRSVPMLERLHHKLGRLPAAVRARVRAVAGDYRAVEPGGDLRFGLVAWPFNALHHCADDADLRAVLARARGWVASSGQLALDAYLPDVELYSRDPEARYEPRSFVLPSTGEVLTSWEQGRWDPVARVHHVIYVYRWPDGTERRVHLELRMFELDEIRAALAATGWSIVSEAADFRGRPLTSDALKWVGRAAPV